MIKLEYETVENTEGGRYCIDWACGERKYKVPYQSIRVYESGLIEVTQTGARQPYWRRHVKRTYALDFRLLSGLAEYKLSDPDTGIKVAKRHILNKWYPFLLDLKWGRLYTGNMYGSKFTFMSEHAQPLSSVAVSYRVPNKAKYKERMSALEEHFALGITLSSVAANSTNWPYYLMRDHVDICEGSKPIPQDFTELDTQKFCVALAHQSQRASRLVSVSTSDVHTAKYLNVKGV